MTDSQTLLAELGKLHKKEIDLGLDRITRLLTALGVQPKTMQTSIHIAGTNGKGSVLATLKAIAEADGKSVNMYSSPHLIRFHERITLKGKEIEEGALCALLQEVKQKNKTAPISFFEATTAAAFAAMSRNGADINLIETGLGGRLDATNLCTPTLCAITPISHDHEEYLGTDIKQIAREKAGIFKKNTPAIIAPQQKEILEVLEEEAEKKQTP
ncbi:MAG: bifunctional folylpolyglutamate synthase/dihydrofolate synthase, partial [Parvibaculales bacterium]